MSKARIYQPDKNAMQSGRAKDSWVLEFAPEAKMPLDPLMGWNGMTDTTREIRLSFPDKESAIAYAKKQRLDCDVFEPNARTQVAKAYADNFKFTRKDG